MDIRYNSYYIAGLSFNTIYLASSTAPFIFKCNYSLADSQSIKLTLPLIKTTTPEAFHFTVDSPNIYVIDRLTASVYYGDIKDSCKLAGRLDSSQFLGAIPISPNSFIIRTYDKIFGQNVLKKIELQKDNSLSKVFQLEKYHEGVFSTDGMLHYDRNTSRLVYVYYYRNQFSVLDTNLTMVFKGKTVDTITTPQIKVAEIKSDKINTLSAPPLVVNTKSCVFENWLFINSGLCANNENKELFDEYSVIDVYSLDDFQYKFSFYIPKYKSEKIREFKVCNNTLIAIYSHFLVTYQLNL